MGKCRRGRGRETEKVERGKVEKVDGRGDGRRLNFTPANLENELAGGWKDESSKKRKRGRQQTGRGVVAAPWCREAQELSPRHAYARYGWKQPGVGTTTIAYHNKVMAQHVNELCPLLKISRLFHEAVDVVNYCITCFSIRGSKPEGI